MFRVMMNSELVVGEVVLKAFETLKEAEDFLADCKYKEIEAYGEVEDEFWIEEDE